jgi:hypothetical protein
MQLNELKYYKYVPKDFERNIEFRKMLVRDGCADRNVAAELVEYCSKDFLFWINAFCMTYDPRRTPAVLPMITYPFQDEAMLEYFNAYGKYDVLTEKSRDMGATWMHLYIIKWYLDFGYSLTSLIGSRTEDLVDKRGDKDSLFWKIEFIDKYLPPFLKADIVRRHLHFGNAKNDCTVDGCSTNDDLGRGGRRTTILLDEFAAVTNGHAILNATRDVTRCRFYNSTPKGQGGAFYDLRAKGNIKIIRLHWSKHPEKARGMYRWDDKAGKLEIFNEWHGTVRIGDKTYKFPEEYPFQKDGKLRSPWYDIQCFRAAHPMEIAQELDIDYLGSNHLFFDPIKLDAYKAKYCALPLEVGELSFSVDRGGYELRLAKAKLENNEIEAVKLEKIIKNWNVGVIDGFAARKDGRLRLWRKTEDGKLPTGKYVVSADVAVGTGSSNSVLNIGDYETSEKIGEFASSTMTPDKLADYAWAIARWLGDCKIVWEQNGPGRLFGKRLTDPELEDGLGYYNVYYKRRKGEDINRRSTTIPGWASTNDSKKTLLGAYSRAINEELIRNYSFEALSECDNYIYTATGQVEHSASLHTIDPTGARENHGDRVIADALLHMMFVERPFVKDVVPDKEPTRCLAARMRRRELEEESKDGWRRKWA